MNARPHISFDEETKTIDIIVENGDYYIHISIEENGLTSAYEVCNGAEKFLDNVPVGELYENLVH